MATAPTGVAIRALADEGLVERVRPFAAAALVGLISALVLPSHPDQMAVGLALSAATVGAALLVPWRRLPAWAELGVPLLYLAAVGYLRFGAGGGESGMSVLVLVPIVWTALYGSRGQLHAVIAAAAATIILPIVVVGPPLYPEAEWRRVLLMTAIGAMIGITVQRLVTEVRRRAVEIAAASEHVRASEVRVRSVLEAAPEPVVTLDEGGRIHAWNAAAEQALGWTESEVVGRTAFELLLPEEARAELAARFATMLTRPDGPSQARRLAADIVGRSGTRIPVEMSVAITTAGEQRLMHIFARDVTDRVAAERALAEHTLDLERLLAVARALSESTDGAEARGAIVEQARDLAGATLAVLLEPDPSGGTLVYTAAAGREPPPVRLAITGRTHSAEVFRTGHSTFVSDLRADTPTSRLLVETTGVTSGLWQPVRRGGKTLGVLVTFWAEDRPAPPSRLASLLELFAAEAASAIERVDFTARLMELSIRDPLTGAANRRGFDEILERELARALRTVTPLSIVMLDLDHFKRYNDEHGHPAGDALLHDTAAAWQVELRSTDTLARFGGEEFVATLPDCDLGSAMRLAHRLLRVVPGGQTASAGVACWNAGETAAGLIARADAALYASKSAGRNRALAA